MNCSSLEEDEAKISNIKYQIPLPRRQAEKTQIKIKKI